MKVNRQISFLILVFFWSFPTALALTEGDAQNPRSKDKNELPTFRYQDQCGNPVYESMLWSMVIGTVVEVIDGSTMTIRLGDKEVWPNMGQRANLVIVRRQDGNLSVANCLIRSPFN